MPPILLQVSGSECLSEPLSVVIVATSMNVDQQKQAVEIANEALDRCGLENEIATFIKQKMEELSGSTWHVLLIYLGFCWRGPVGHPLPTHTHSVSGT